MSIINYEDKYLKYKKKYLDLKNSMIGGSNDVYNLTHYYNKYYYISFYNLNKNNIPFKFQCELKPYHIRCGNNTCYKLINVKSTIINGENDNKRLHIIHLENINNKYNWQKSFFTF